MLEKARCYVLRSKKEEAPEVMTLSLAFKDGGIPEFIPGQYLNIYFPQESKKAITRAYSISSSPLEKYLDITVHAIGENSKYLNSLLPSSEIMASLPTGLFGVENKKGELVLIAGGIGVTPFRSILFNTLKLYPKRRVSLFYSSRKEASVVFKKDLDKLQKLFKNFSIYYFITQERGDRRDFIYRRFRLADIFSKLDSPLSAEFLICGSLPFTNKLVSYLRRAGIQKENIHTEAFFSS